MVIDSASFPPFSDNSQSSVKCDQCCGAGQCDQHKTEKRDVKCIVHVCNGATRAAPRVIHVTQRFSPKRGRLTARETGKPQKDIAPRASSTKKMTDADGGAGSP